MGQETTISTESTDQRQTLDFLYIDDDRVESIIATQYRGNLKQITTSRQVSESTSEQYKGDAKIFSGQKGTTHNNVTKEESTFDPYYTKILDLINDLRLPVIQDISEAESGKLINFNAKISIQDSALVDKITPFLSRHQKILGFTKSNGFDPKMIQAASDFIKIQNGFISLKVHLDTDTFVKGALNDKYLKLSPFHISMIYGLDFPGYWNVIGIYDRISSRRNNTNDNNLNNISYSFIDVYRSLNDNTPHKIIPILIFRSINL